MSSVALDGDKDADKARQAGMMKAEARERRGGNESSFKVHNELKHPTSSCRELIDPNQTS